MTIAGMHASDMLDLLTLTTMNAGALAILVALVTLIGRRWIAARYRCLMWTLVALRLAIPIAPASPFSMQQAWRPDQTPTDVNVHHGIWVQVSAAADPVPAAEPAAFRSGATQPQVTMGGMLFTVWASGAVISLLILGVSTARFRRKLRSQAMVGIPERRQLLEACRQLTGVRRHVRLLEVAGLHSPALMGLFRPTVLLPVDLAETLSDEQLRHVFLHELAHVKRCDVAINGLLALLRILHWWNPLYWLVQSRLIAEREQACDVQVLKCLGTAERHAYGETLLGVVARLTTSAEQGVRLPTSALGQVTFLGQKSSLRRRLRSLKVAGRGEMKVQRVAGAMLTLVLLVVGGTDRPDSAAVAEDRAFQIPADTTWSLAPIPAASNEELSAGVYDGELITRVYGVDDVVDSLMRTYGLSVGDARTLMQQPVEALFPPEPPAGDTDVAGPFFNWYEGDDPQGEMLIVRASFAHHKALAALLSVWRKHGPEQISLEVRLITASEDQPLPLGGGGRIVSPGTGSLSQHSANNSRSEEFPVNSAAGAQGRIISERRVPVYVQTLGAESCRRVIQEVQSDAGANVMMAPKVTLFNGQHATVTSAVHRPFVTGLDDSSGSIEPQIEVIQDGLSLKLSAVSDATTRRIRLDCHLSLDTIVDVSETSVSRGEGVEPLTIQVPQVESQQYAASGEVADGESLLIAPLNVDDTGRRLYAIITPRRVTPDVSTRDEE